MRNVIYIESESMDAAFHFSAEEFCMQHFTADEPVMMIWQTQNCAMLGSCQVAEAEIDLGVAQEAGIQIVRRSSGGGTIFTDPGTLLYTVILPFGERDNPKDIVNTVVAGPVIRALGEMGIPAKLEGRNDIVVDGRKISGMAQFVRRNRLCSHGSLLYDADLETLTRVLRVDEEKIKSKALRSVRSRVTNLIEYMDRPVSTREFRELLREKLFETQDVREYILTDADIQKIEEIRREKYANPEWTYGRSPRFTWHSHRRFPGGKVEVFLDVEKGIVNACSIRGDFLGLLPIRSLEERMEDRPFLYDAMREAIDGVDLNPYLGGVTQEQLLGCMFAL